MNSFANGRRAIFPNKMKESSRDASVRLRNKNEKSNHKRNTLEFPVHAYTHNEPNSAIHIFASSHFQIFADSSNIWVALDMTLFRACPQLTRKDCEYLKSTSRRISTYILNDLKCCYADAYKSQSVFSLLLGHKSTIFHILIGQWSGSLAIGRRVQHFRAKSMAFARRRGRLV